MKRWADTKSFDGFIDSAPDGSPTLTYKIYRPKERGKMQVKLTENGPVGSKLNIMSEANGSSYYNRAENIK